MKGASNPGPPGYRPHPLHTALVVSDLLSRIPPALISPALIGMAAIAAWPWQEPALQALAGGWMLLLVIGDGLSLALLPRLGRSFGPVTPPLLALACLRTAITGFAGLFWPIWPALLLVMLCQLALTGVHIIATWVEPFRVVTTYQELRHDNLTGHTPLRILHISDIHFEGWTPREHLIIDRAQELAPDLILMTGDYLNLSTVENRASQEGARDLLAALADVAPTWAITGSPPVDRVGVVPEIFEGLEIHWLLDEMADLEIKDHRLRLLGLRCTRERAQDGPRLHQILQGCERDLFTLLLYHSPDLMPDAVEAGIDLYLCGHTHGGQLRLPFFGALITSSDFWKRYEAGLYREGQTTLYVSRGLGVEGMGAPRARFLAAPELVLWTLRSDASHQVNPSSSSDEVGVS